MKTNVQIIENPKSFKVGVNEVVGMRNALLALMRPIQKYLQETQSWGSPNDWFEISDAEYVSRDGFIPYSHNCGGLEISQVIPACGALDFPFCAFLEFEPDVNASEDENERQRDIEEGEGLLDSHLRVFLKFEGFDEKGVMQFYLNVCTCDEAPYFRLAYSKDIFETEFKAKTLADLRRVGMKHVKRCIATLKKAA